MADIPSPCIRNCCLNRQDICVGCYRSMDEIMQWAQSDNKQKRLILEMANTRRKQQQQMQQ